MGISTMEAAVGLVVVLGVCCLQAPSCRCAGDEPRAPDASVEPPDAAPTASQGVLMDASPDAPGEPGEGWEPVLGLGNVAGQWGGPDGETLVIISSRAEARDAGAPWPYPYPWHLHIHEPGDPHPEPYDCGFHETYQDAGAGPGWRVAYCQGGHWGTERRYATTLYLEVKELPDVELIRVRLGSDVEAIASRR